MIRSLLTFGAVLAITFSSALAGTHEIPKKDPVASFTFPEGWKVEREDGDSLDAESPDEDLFINIQTYELKDLTEAVAESLKGLSEAKITFDKASEKKTDAVLGGLEVVNYDWDGKLEGQACKISLTVFSGGGEKVLLMLYWATPESEKKHAKALASIQQSIKKASK